MRVGSSGDDAEAFGGQRLRQHFCIRNNLARVIAKLRPQSFAETDCFGSNDVNEWTALHSRKNNFVYGSSEFLFRENHSRARAA